MFLPIYLKVTYTSQIFNETFFTKESEIVRVERRYDTMTTTTKRTSNETTGLRGDEWSSLWSRTRTRCF